MSDISLPVSQVAKPPADTALMFANTRFWRGRHTPTETINDFADLARWTGGRLGLDPAALAPLLAWAERNAGPAGAVLAESLAVREALYHLFQGRAAGASAAADDLGNLNAALALAPQRLELVSGTGGFAWRLPAQPLAMPALLGPVLWSAADLLTEGAAPIRQCANPQCLWLFLDVSRNGTRRWCDMSSCGNRAKARRHYLKSKKV